MSDEEIMWEVAVMTAYWAHSLVYTAPFVGDDIADDSSKENQI